MDPPRIPRPSPLPTPNLNYGAYQVHTASWTHHRAPITGWWNENRSIRGLWDEHPNIYNYISNFGTTAWARFMRAAMGSFKGVEYGVEGPEWGPVRVLGEGGYGMAGLWQRRDEQGRVWAEMVIKQESRRVPPRDDNPEHEVPGMRGLLYEVLLQNDLNRLPDSININHLMDFKWNTFSNMFRMYMINNPHQDLWKLKMKYGMFDTFLPELFIWTVFISLLEGIVLMETDPSTRTVPAAIPVGSTPNARPFMLHFDLKHNNVFLDHQGEMQDLWNNYPTVRIADFGQARYTHTNDVTNPQPALRWRGTREWKPPEATQWKEEAKYTSEGITHHWWQGDHWQPEPGKTYVIDQAYKNPPNQPDQKFDKSHNLWCVGKIVCDLMTMTSDGHMQKDMDATMEDVFNDNDDHFLEAEDGIFEILNDDGGPYLHAYNNWPYCERLQELVRECLKPAAHERPETADVLEAARNTRDAWLAGMREEHENDNPELFEAATRLYFRENEINGMPRGPANFPDFDNRHYQLILNFDDPDWEEFAPPASKWTRIRGRDRHGETVIDRGGILYFGNSLGDAIRNAEIGAREREQRRPPKTREQWLSADFFEVLKETAKKQGWDENQARKMAAVRTKDQLVDVLMGSAVDLDDAAAGDNGVQDSLPGVRSQSISSSALSSLSSMDTPTDFSSEDSDRPLAKRRLKRQQRRDRKDKRAVTRRTSKQTRETPTPKPSTEAARASPASRQQRQVPTGQRKSRRLRKLNPTSA